MNFKFLVWTLVLLLPGVLRAQVTVSGTVRDAKSGETLPGAHVSIENNYKVVATNQQGFFSISNLKKGTCLLKVSYMGYKTYEETLNLTSENQKADIKLERSTIMEETVIITSTRASDETPTTFKNISRKELTTINTGRDIPYLIESTPSVVVTSDAGAGVGYTNIRVRGTDITRINVTANGIPVNDAESHGVWFVNMPDFASSVENLQIQRGVGTSSNGAAAFGASINFQTQSLKAEPYAEVNNSYGSFNTWKNTVSAGTGLMRGKFAIDARLSRISSDGYMDRASSDLQSFYLSAGYYGKKDILKFITFSGKEKTYQAWTGVPSSLLETNRTYNPSGKYYDAYGKLHYYDNETDNYQQDHYQLHYSHEFNQNWNANAALHLTKGYGYYEQYKDDTKYSKYGLPNYTHNGDTLKKTDLIRRKYLDNDFYGTTFSANYDSRKKLQASFGGGWNKYDGNHFGNIIWMQYAGVIPNNYEWYRSTGVKTDWNAYAKAYYKLTSKLSLYGDIQFRGIKHTIEGIDDNLRTITQEHSYHFFNPKAGLSYKLNDKNQFYASFAIANREPNRSNFVDANPGVVPNPERLQNIEAGYHFNSNSVAVAINGFYMNYKDQLVLTGDINDVGDPVMMNVAKSYRMGIEASVNWKICKKINWELNTTLSRNKIQDFTETIFDYDNYVATARSLGKTDISFSPNVVANSNLSWEALKNFTLTLQTKYVGKQYIDNTSSNDRKLDAYLVNNLRMNYTLDVKKFPELNFIFGVNNLLDKKYISNAWVGRDIEGGEIVTYDGYFPQAGRNFMIGLNMKF
jgi:iron complex outermembrane recepter protein